MHSLPLTILSLLLWLTSNANAALAPQKLVVVVTADWGNHCGRLFAFDYQRKEWQQAFAFPVVVGKNGLGWGRGLWISPRPGEPVKKEGDGKAPAGCFDIRQCLYGYAVRPPWRFSWPYVQLTANWVGVDDPASRYYNRVFDQIQIRDRDWNSHENMRRSDDLYQWLLVVEHNTGNPVANAGSCIFLHIWRNPHQATAGCTAMAKKHLLKLIHWLSCGNTNALVQLPLPIYNRYRTDREWPLLEDVFQKATTSD